MFTLEEFVCADRVYKLTTSRNACTSRSTRTWTGTKVSANIDQGEKNGSSLSILLQFDLWNFSNKKKLQQKNSTMLDYIPHVCGCLPCMGQQWADNSSKRCKKHKTPRKKLRKKNTQLIGKNQLSNTCCLHRTLCKENPDASLPDTKVCVCCIIHTGVGG